MNLFHSQVFFTCQLISF
jgi:hypothetical protein